MSFETPAPSLEQGPSLDVSKDVGAIAAAHSVVLQQQIDMHTEYVADIIIQPADSEAQLSHQETIHRLETDHTVKHAPRFKNQCKDRSRTNTLKYDKFYDKHNEGLKSMTEHKALQEMRRYVRDLKIIPAGPLIHVQSSRVRK